MTPPLLSLILMVGGLLLSVEGLARVTWNYSLLRMRNLSHTRAERRAGANPKIDATNAGLVALGLTLATLGLFLYL